MNTFPDLIGPELSPRSGGSPKQLVLLLHGLGADGNDLFPIAQEFAPFLPDAHFISLQAPYPCDMAPMGYQWFSLQDRSEETLRKEVGTIAPVLDHCIDQQLQRFSLDDSKLALLGFSQGTMMALFTSIRRARPCAGVLGYSGLLIDGDGLDAVVQSRPPICLIHGDADMVVPFECTPLAANALKQSGFTVDIHRCEGIGHGIDAKGLKLGIEFLTSCYGIDLSEAA